MVLQERIELSTSPLPRECSTTELLQHTCLSAMLRLVLAGRGGDLALFADGCKRNLDPFLRLR